MTKEGLHLRRSLGQWTHDSNLEWRYTQSPTNVLFDTTLRLQAISVLSSRRSTTFSVWRPASRITTFSIPAAISSQYPLTAASRGTTVQVTPATPTPISFEAHLLRQPPGPRLLLLQKFEQHVSDTCMIEHLRSIKSKTISTDDGLSLIGQGTFGWMLTDAKGKQLVTGSGAGPVDGPATQASSTRSELDGFSAPMEYIHQLSRYYSMRPRGQYEWECDSQCAITRTNVLLKFKQRWQQPCNVCLFHLLKFIYDWQPTNSSLRSPTMSRSGSALAGRQLWKTMITFSDVPLKRAHNIWRCKILAAPFLKQNH